MTKEELKEYHKAYYIEHRNEVKEYNIAHRDENLSKKKAYHIAHHGEILVKQKAYRIAHYDRIKAYSITYREEFLANRYCSDIENVENFALAKADNFNGWVVHHRLETHFSDGQRRLVNLSEKELIALGTYYHRPADELIFMRHGEHISLHKSNAK